MTDGITLQTFTGVDRPVLVKTATTPEARNALEREADRLRRGRHPGVVELLSASQDRLEIAWAGTHTLETARLSLPAAAGVLAAVATTVADLHALGIVHGRLDPSHVVLAGDGRPFLCGMGGPDVRQLSIGPADDVAAIGRLIDHLLGPEAELEPIPERRWSRRNWTGYHRRTLQLLADRAAHDDPARRPTSRAVANAIVEAVPDARLLPATPISPPDSDEPVADGSTIDADPPTDTDADTHRPDDRPGTAGAGPADLDEPAEHAEVESPSDQAFELDAPTMSEMSPDQDRGRTETILGLRIEDPPADPVRRPPPDVPVAPTTRARHPGRLVGVAAVAVAVVGAVRLAGAAADHPVEEAIAPVTTAAIPASSNASKGDPSTETPHVPSAATVASDGGVPRLDRSGVTFAVGRPEDRVTVADWNCDGTETPGLVRPGTGEVFFFDRWAAADQPVTVRPAVVVPGALELAAPPPDGPCAATLHMSDGAAVELVHDDDEGWTTRGPGA